MEKIYLILLDNIQGFVVPLGFVDKTVYIIF